jgi:hypothetical protein
MSLRRLRNTTGVKLGSVLLLVASIVRGGDRASVFRIQIHPKAGAKECSTLPAADALPEEDDYPRLLKRGWVKLQKSNFDEHREFYPCLQDVVVTFPEPKAFYQFVATMSACPQYPFYSGADYALQTAIFERAAQSGDADAYQRLLAKDGRCVSELNPPLYSVLRRNPERFLQTFRRLSESQQLVVAATQYDFNLELRDQQFGAGVLSKLPGEVVPAARRFNELLAREAHR